MQLCLRAPAIPEQANWHEQRTRYYSRTTELGLPDAVIASLKALVGFIVERGGDLGAKEKAKAKADVV